MNCPVCSLQVIDEASFCHHCGTPLGDNGVIPTPREQFQAAAAGSSDEDPPERELWQGSFSKLAMIGSWIGAAAFTLAIFIIAVVSDFTGRGWLISVMIVLCVWGALVVRLVFLQLSRHYYLSNQRFVHERGLLWREIDRIEAIDIDDVSFSQGPIERLLGVGTVRILSSDQSHPTMELPGIENVRAVSSLIDETRRQERRRRGLHIEAV